MIDWNVEDKLTQREMEEISYHRNLKCAYCKHMESGYTAYPYKRCNLTKDKHCKPCGCKLWEWNGWAHPDME